MREQGDSAGIACVWITRRSGSAATSTRIVVAEAPANGEHCFGHVRVRPGDGVVTETGSGQQDSAVTSDRDVHGGLDSGPDDTSESGSDAAAVSRTGRVRWLSPRTKRVLQALISLVLLGFIIWFVFRQFADFSSVLEVLRTLTWTEGLVLAAIAVVNLLTYWIVLVIATPGLTVPQAGVLTQSTTAVANTVPAGGAVALGLTYTMMSSWGFSKSRTTLSVVVTGIWNNFLKLGMPIFALALVLLQGQSGGGRMIAALAGLGGLVG